MLSEEKIRPALLLAAGWAKGGERLTFYTHDGKAHVDELVAISVAIALLRSKGAPMDVHIFRLPEESIPKVLNKGEFVIDAGRQFDGIKRIDHHQLSSSEDCSASLLIKAWAPELLEVPYFRSFIQRITIQDNFGLSGVSARLKTGTAFQPFLTFEFMAVRNFVKNPVKEAVRLAEWVYTEVVLGRNDHLNADAWMEVNSHITVTSDGIKYLSARPFTEGVDHGMRGSLVGAMGRKASACSAAVGIYYDEDHRYKWYYRYGPGIALGINFSRCRGLPGVISESIHKNGYLMKVSSDADPEQIIKSSLTVKEEKNEEKES